MSDENVRIDFANLRQEEPEQAALVGDDVARKAIARLRHRLSEVERKYLVGRFGDAWREFIKFRMFVHFEDLVGFRPRTRYSFQFFKFLG